MSPSVAAHAGAALTREGSLRLLAAYILFWTLCVISSFIVRVSRLRSLTTSK